ncbi:MAG TPA: NOB1 family endonuclease [Methanoregulaceae archaeon]|nr:NOB1 family endonuclease [Methanoregulaceae archaeon]
MTVVLDASAFFAAGEAVVASFGPGDRLLTTPSVLAEVRDAAARCRLELALERGLAVLEPSASSLGAVDAGVVASGDADRLSVTDRDLLALALEHGGTLVTDDFALQNAALRLGVGCRPIAQRQAAPRRRGYRCAGCGRFGEGPGECPICGSAIVPVRTGRSRGPR